ncbi:hypothetical protein HMN09_01093900 [Mycena chlorophos]|uniref:Uncharacterized protein n=1 Tax=Mycena chlorophos TaxID=658473 RepID=A0A8H6SDE0_MYCCL|nr:hypothetical protein HMN09_01093900 [Mycena chlorophos]
MSNHEPSTGESDVVGVLSRALSNAQKETGELKNRVQELEESARGTVSQAEHSALRNAYDFERANSRKLEQTLKNHEAEAKRREASLAEERAAMQEQLFGVQQQAESLVCQASNEIRGALAHRALALQERGTLEMALYASNTEAHTAQVQLEELLLQHVELKKRYEALVSKRNSSSPRLPLETSSDEEGFPTLAKLKMNERIENLTQSAAKVKELNAKLASVNHDLEASLKARLKLQAQCSELNTANTALTARLREMAQSYTSAKAENTEQVASFEKTIADLRVQLAESEARARTKIKQEQQEILLSPSGPPVSPPNERQRYLDFMAPFKAPSLSRRLPFEDNQPIINAREAQDIIHASVWKHERPYLFLPNRTIWCTPNREHALTFAPVLEVNQNARAASNPAQRWVPHSAMLARCGREFELFALGDAERGMGNLLFYMGTYRVHSLRGVVAPGSVAPTDVCPLTIERAMKLNSSTATREKLTLRDLYPDGLARTECFGLQCFGFDWELYRSLRARSKIPVQVQSLKRVWVEGPHAKGLSGGVVGKEKDKKKGTGKVSRRIAPLPHTSSNTKPPSVPFFAQTSSRAALIDGLGLPTKPLYDANEDERSVLLGRDLRVLAPMHDPMESVVVPERKPALSWTTRARPPVDNGWAGRRLTVSRCGSGERLPVGRT